MFSLKSTVEIPFALKPRSLKIGVDVIVRTFACYTTFSLVVFIPIDMVTQLLPYDVSLPGYN